MIASRDIEGEAAEVTTYWLSQDVVGPAATQNSHCGTDSAFALLGG
jgi:hypothetical protein